MRTLSTLVIYIFCSLLLGKAYANTEPEPTKKKKPRNIIFILTDDHRFLGVEKIEGSYFNVMGLPLQRMYHELKDFLDEAQ